MLTKKRMKFGLKDYYKKSVLDKFAKHADFLEVQGLRNKNYNFLKKYNSYKPILLFLDSTSYRL